MTRETVKRGVVPALLMVLTGVGAPQSQACQICVPLPQATIADHLIDSDGVVMAREDPERPFHYVAIEVLKGDPGEEAIDTFLNSRARRILMTDPAYAMVLARSPQDDRWIALGIARGGDFEAVIRRVLERDDWVSRDSTDLARVMEFAKLLGHPDRRLHELAYLEVGRAPYSLIKEVSPLVPLGKMRAMLEDFQYAEWHSLAILLLGHSDSAIDRNRVYAELEMAHRMGVSRNLAAWATALIEMDGTEGLLHIEELYVDGPRRSAEELEQLVLALSTHGKTNAGLRDNISDIYRRLMQSNPDMASGFVLDLVAWERWDFVDEYRRFRQDMGPGDPLGNYAINLYLDTALRAKAGVLN